MIRASDFEKIRNQVKEKKFGELVDIQQRFIKENMEKMERNVLWIFSDREYYHEDYAKSWFEEFQKRAKDLFEQNGFVISGILITW